MTRKDFLLGAGATAIGTVSMGSPIRSILGSTHNSFDVKDVVSTAVNYVQDGLVAMYDGIENAGWGLHNSNAISWKDLVGGIGDMHPFVSQAPEWGDNCWTKHVPRAANTGFRGFYADSLLPSPLTGVIAINPCFNATLENWSAAALFTNRTTWTTGAFQYATNSNNQKMAAIANGLQVMKNGTVNLPFIGTSYCEVSSGSNSFLNSRFYIGSMMDGLYPLSNIDLFCLRVYNRSLSDDEIAYNNEIDNMRFGL